MSATRSSPSAGERPTITVRGEATLRAAPDETLLWVTFEALEEDPGRALANVSRRGDALAVVLDELDVPARDRSTSIATVREELEHTHTGRRSLGHRATLTVIARLADPAKIGLLATRAAAELQAQVGGPRWQIADANPVRLEAAQAAAAHARAKAEAFAAGIGARVGAVVKAIEPDAGDERWQPLRGTAAASGSPMPIEVGEQVVSAAIDVTFALERA